MYYDCDRELGAEVATERFREDMHERYRGRRPTFRAQNIAGSQITKKDLRPLAPDIITSSHTAGRGSKAPDITDITAASPKAQDITDITEPQTSPTSPTSPEPQTSQTPPEPIPRAPDITDIPKAHPQSPSPEPQTSQTYSLVAHNWLQIKRPVQSLAHSFYLRSGIYSVYTHREPQISRPDRPRLADHKSQAHSMTGRYLMPHYR